MADALTRDLVVTTARAHLEARGADGVSLRGIARELGVTAPALYLYVEDKDDLLAAVATEHFAALAERFAAVDEADPLDRIRALSRAYVHHARSSPELFRLMFRYPPAPAGGVEPFPPAARAFAVAAAATEAAVASGQLAVDDAATAQLTMWAAVHGATEILLMGYPFDDRGAEAFVDTVVDTVLAGQQRGGVPQR